MPLGVARPLDGVPGLDGGAEREASGEVLVVGGEAFTLDVFEVRSLLEAGVELADVDALLVVGLIDVLGFLAASATPSFAVAAARALGVPTLGTAPFLTAVTPLDTLPALPLLLRPIAAAPTFGVAGFDRTPAGLVLADPPLAADSAGLAARTGEARTLVGDFVVDSTRGLVLARDAAVGAAAVECLRAGVAGERALSALEVEAWETAETLDSLREGPVGDSGSSVEGNGTATGGGELHSGEPGADSRPLTA